LISLLKKNNTIKLKEVDSDYFSKEYFAERPPNERLINRKLDIRKINIMRDWKVALKEYLDNYYLDYLKK
jgi:dTDP-4-dehydrorhamnose reductase